jgi:hypothetical protein
VIPALLLPRKKYVPPVAEGDARAAEEAQLLVEA